MKNETMSLWTISSHSSLPDNSDVVAVSNTFAKSHDIEYKSVEMAEEHCQATVMNSLSERIIHRVHHFYRHWAVFVSRYSFTIIAFCTVLSIIGAVKMATTKRRNNIRGYTPYGSRSLHEFDVRDEFFDQSGTGVRFIAIIVPRNATPVSVRRASDGSSYIVRDEDNNAGGNLLDADAFAEIVHVDDVIKNNLLIYNRLTGQNETFAQICRLFCDVNDPVRAFYSGMRHQMERLRNGEAPTSRINLSYPISTIFGREINLLPNFFDVNLKENQNWQPAQMLFHHSGSTSASLRQHEIIDNIERLGMVVLLYRAERIGGWTDQDIFDYEMSVHAYFKNHNFGKHVRILTISSSYVAHEVDRAGQTLRPYVLIGLGVMILCAIITCTLSAVYARQMSIYKMVLATFACICPFLASGTALGLLFFCGMRHSSILSVTPFLILALGVDDAFLTIHAWQNVRRRKGVTVPIEKRLADVLEETGPAILISALTNIFADVVGSFTGSPEITLLCVANITSIIIDFFYQITFFTAVLILVARMEETGSLRRLPTDVDAKNSAAIVHTSVPAINLPEKTSNSFNTIKKQNEQNLQQKKEKRASGSSNSDSEENGGFSSSSSTLANYVFVEMRTRFVIAVDAYIRGVTNMAVAVSVCAAWAIFLIFCLQMETYREERILPSYTMAQIFINRPGNLSNPQRRAQLDRLVAEMEALPNAIGAAQGGTRYFMRDFLVFEGSFMTEGAIEEDNDEPRSTFKDNNRLESSRQNSTSSFLSTTTTYSLQSTPEQHIRNLFVDDFRRRDATNFMLDRRHKRLTNRQNREIAHLTVPDTTITAETVHVNVEADLKAFLEWPEYQFWRTFLKYHPENNTSKGLILDRIMIIVGFRGLELRDWYKRAHMLSNWRHVIDVYGADFNASVLHDEGLYLDLLENMTTDIWQSLIGTLTCMTVICALFMNSRFVVFVATNVIASIIIYTLGIMALQNMTIDPVVMAAVIISLGFSVDIPTHISYHFHVSGKPLQHGKTSKRSQRNAKHNDDDCEKESKMNKNDISIVSEVETVDRSCEQRIRMAFSSVGYPAIQASICMNICLLCFLLVPVYIAQVFIRVMCLCSVLCAFHSFVLLPALFTVVDAFSHALSSACTACIERKIIKEEPRISKSNNYRF